MVDRTDNESKNSLMDAVTLVVTYNVSGEIPFQGSVREDEFSQIFSPCGCRSDCQTPASNPDILWTDAQKSNVCENRIGTTTRKNLSALPPCVRYSLPYTLYRFIVFRYQIIMTSLSYVLHGCGFNFSGTTHAHKRRFATELTWRKN